MYCGLNEETIKKYGLRCQKCGGKGDSIYATEDNCIDHIIDCPHCKETISLHENDEDYYCIGCGLKREMIYSMYGLENGHIAEGFGLCQRCYNILIVGSDKPKEDMKSAIKDFIEKIKRKEVSNE